jgi:hypothetical protein
MGCHLLVQAQRAAERKGGEVMDTGQVVWFHGTRTRKSSESIKKHGFRAGTQFARHMEDAVCFGGPYVFFVRIQFNPKAWQACCSEVVPPSAIIGCCYVPSAFKMRKAINTHEYTFRAGAPR